MTDGRCPPRHSDVWYCTTHQNAGHFARSPAAIRIGKKKVSTKEVFDADQQQMHAKHADKPERIAGDLPFARIPVGHAERLAMTTSDGSFSLCASACFACICC